MLFTNPVNAFVPEGCSQSATVDQSVYTLAPALGGVTDPLSPGESAVVADQSTYPTSPAFSDLIHSSATEWRLVDDLRAVAAKPGTDLTQAMKFPPPAGWDQRAPLQALLMAAQALANSDGSLFSQHKIRAMADLAVTGRLAYETLSAMGFVTPQDVVNAVRALDASLNANIVQQVVDRAQKVAWAIRGNPSWRAALRPLLGWIAVSGEDDAPHRPCNVFSLPVPQYDLKVAVGGFSLTTRIAIAEAPYPTPVIEVGDPPAFLPPDELPFVSSESDVIFLYMPGDSSRAEEAGDLIPAIFDEARARGKKATVISIDMIGWGYSSRRAFDDSGNTVLFDQTLFPTVKYPDNPPALQFVEDFVVALLQKLSAGPTFMDLNRVVPIGGSLGGNLGLRLGRRQGLAWLKGVCSWSAASVWPSKATNPDTGTVVGIGAGVGAAIGAVLGTFIPGVGNLIGAAVGAAVGAIAGAIAGPAGDRAAIGTCTTEMNTLEDPSQRARHFAGVFDNNTLAFLFVVLVPAQADMWYRDDWQPCKDDSMCKDRLDRREVYDQVFRRWHWRISQDQLVFSHRDPDPATGTPRYLLNTVPMLLAAGANDDYSFANIYSWTRELAQKMVVAGTSLFLNDTGHSVHNERPMQLARSIFDFLELYWKPAVAQPALKDVSYFIPLLLED